MKTVKKYLLFAFLIENIIAQTSLLGGISNYLFYPFLAIGAFCMLDPAFWSPINQKKFGWMYLLMGLYIFYEFTIGIQYVDSKTLLYLCSKIVTFGIIIIGISENEEFYKNKAIYLLVIAMAFFLVYGLLTGETANTGTGRMKAGFTNENTAGSMGALTVGFILFYMKNRQWNVLTILIILVGFYGVLSGGSRAGFLMLVMLVFFRYGLNLKTISIVALLLITGLFILPAIGIHTIGIQRMINTYNGIEGTNRELEREAAEWMIAQKPFEGWGYNVKNVGYAAMLTLLPSHNGYLEIAKQMGLPCAIVYFSILACTILRYLRVMRRYALNMNLFLALVLMLLVKANYESSYIGVHEYGTNIFFVALAMLSAQMYSLKKSR